MKRRDDDGGVRQISLCLCYRSFDCDRVDIIRRDIQNLIKFFLRFSETAKVNIRKCLFGEQSCVTGVKSLGLAQKEIASVPLSSSSRDNAE